MLGYNIMQTDICFRRCFMRYTYSKLVRDNIPTIINHCEGRKANWHILDEELFLEELNKKLIEESHEFVEENAVEELADVMEVLETIMKQKNITWQEVRKVQDAKRLKNGGFQDKIFLDYVEEEQRNLAEEKELAKSFRKSFK